MAKPFKWLEKQSQILLTCLFPNSILHIFTHAINF